MHSALCAGVCEQGLEWALRERQPCRCLAAARQKSDHRLNAAPAGEKLRKNQSHVPAAACHCLPASSNQNRKCAANFNHILIHDDLIKEIC